MGRFGEPWCGFEPLDERMQIKVSIIRANMIIKQNATTIFAHREVEAVAPPVAGLIRPLESNPVPSEDVCLVVGDAGEEFAIVSTCTRWLLSSVLSLPSKAGVEPATGASALVHLGC